LKASALRVEAGRFLPLVDDCASMGTGYTPVSLELRHSAAVISGSNMGGKTVALQSLLFFQILAQSGMYVPAARYEGKLYDFIEYVGEGGGGGGSRGLSGFGREMKDLSGILHKAESGACLAAFDEFARTTGSEEAEALLSEVVGRFAGALRCTALFATHFGRIERDGNVQWLRMAGLDRKAAREFFGAGSADTLGVEPRDASGEETDAASDARLRDINRLMRYEIIEDEPGRGGASASSDALEIATLLGLDASLVAGARRRLAARGGGEGDES
jgi:DNA mismatch repair ATPase MutS